MTCTITTTGAGTVTLADGEVISYAGAGKFCTGFKMGKFERDIRPVYAPGEDGGGTQDFGVRFQDFTVEVTYIDTTEAALEADIAADLAIAANVSSIAFPNQTFAGCKLQDSDFDQARVADIIVGTKQCKGRLRFRSMRPTG